jgi:hypothetical protein
VTAALRFGLDMPAQAVPRRHCPCGWHGGATMTCTGEHWEQRSGVKLAQGEESLVLEAVASARANAEGSSGRKASPEWSPTDC